MPALRDLADKAPAIIKEAARSRLGVISLTILSLSVLAALFFTKSGDSVKLIVYLSILVGASLFILRLTQATGHLLDGANPQPPPDADLQAAAVCYRLREGIPEFLLVRTSGGRWIFPKGNVDEGESNAMAAKREAFEEAGADGEVDPEPLGRFRHLKRELKSRGREFTVEAFLLAVTAVHPTREKNRNPTWFSQADAALAVAEDRDFEHAEELRRVLRLAAARILHRVG
ncbi:MAG TPA: NUDIX hydrolase [Thermoanaerobaculia bacterium]|jgi:8-oxo-dGTP pyrophosphatase MutT (NUDIX family)